MTIIPKNTISSMIFSHQKSEDNENSIVIKKNQARDSVSVRLAQKFNLDFQKAEQILTYIRSQNAFDCPPPSSLEIPLPKLTYFDVTPVGEDLLFDLTEGNLRKKQQRRSTHSRLRNRLTKLSKNPAWFENSDKIL